MKALIADKLVSKVNTTEIAAKKDIQLAVKAKSLNIEDALDSVDLSVLRGDEKFTFEWLRSNEMKYVKRGGKFSCLKINSPSNSSALFYPVPST